ncbi:hypothetical protein [Marinicrinis lubricantis]|uniref:Uncharacterized protein n=1 Tax=Marinicrinis lubricantis TaxID=2086470 RepID=A0ABW1IKA2_9BACL
MKKTLLQTMHSLMIAAVMLCGAFGFTTSHAFAEPSPPYASDKPNTNVDIRPVEVFDVTKGKVVKKIPYTPEIQKETISILKSIDGLVTSLKIDPKKGIALRIPVDPAVQLNHSFFKDQVSDAFIFLARAEKPYMLLFTRDNKPVLVHFKHDVQPLVNLLQIQDLIDGQNGQNAKAAKEKH